MKRKRLGRSGGDPGNRSDHDQDEPPAQAAGAAPGRSGTSPPKGRRPGSREGKPGGGGASQWSGQRGGQRGDKTARRSGPAYPKGDLVRLYGIHAVRAALRNPARRYRHLWLSENAARALAPETAALGDRAPGTETDPRAALDRLLPEGSVHQGAVLDVDPLAPVAIDALIPADDDPALVVLLDQITDPQNAGAILRSAAAFGATGLVLTQRNAPPESGALAKAAAGALDQLPVARVRNLAQAIETLRDAGFWTIGLDGAAETAIDEAAPPGEIARIALVLGAEGKGLRQKTAESCDRLLSIPMAPQPPARAGIDSLNVSNAAAIALFALSRWLR